MVRFDSTEKDAPIYVLEDGTGNKWVLTRKPDSRDNCYRLATEYYHSKRYVCGERLDWWKKHKTWKP